MDIQSWFKGIRRLAESYKIGCRIDLFENRVIKLILITGEDKIDNVVLLEAVACMYAARYFGGEFLVNLEEYEEDEYEYEEDEYDDYETNENYNYDELEYYEEDEDLDEDNYDSCEYEDFEEDNSEKVFFIVKFKNDSDRYEFIRGVLCD